MAMILKQSKDFVFREVPMPSDRLHAARLCYNDGTVFHLICNVYMPYYSHENTNDFVATLDQLQALIDDPANTYMPYQGNGGL